MTQVSNPFNFSSTDDLPQELKARFDRAQGQSIANATKYANLIGKAGRAVTILEIEGAAVRVFGADGVPAQATVRKYLNKAVELGLIHKPSEQYYAAGPEQAVRTPAAEVSEVIAEETDGGISELLDEVEADDVLDEL